MGLISSLDRTIARKNTSDKISQLSRVFSISFLLITYPTNIIGTFNAYLLTVRVNIE